MAGLQDLIGLVDTIQAVGGSSQTTNQTTSGGRTTQRTDVSDEGINEILRQILAGPGGVRTIGNSARAAGVYNSTVEDQLYGDLYARASNQAELARSPTITETAPQTTTAVTQTPGVGLGGLAGTLAATSAAGSLMRGEVPFSGVIDSITGMAGGGGNTVASAGSNFAASVPTSSATTAAGPSGGFMSQINTSAGAAPTSLAGQAGNFVGANALPLGGGFLSGILGGSDASEDPTSLALNAALGFASMGPLGLAAMPLSSLIGGQLSQPIQSVGRELERGVRSIGRAIAKPVGTVICTALMYTGHLDKELYKQALRRGKEVSPVTMAGYHYWAVGVAAKIRAGHKGYTAVFKPLVVSRTKMLAEEATGIKSLKYPLGCVCKFVIEPACWVLGKALQLRQERVENGYQS